MYFGPLNEFGHKCVYKSLYVVNSCWMSFQVVRNRIRVIDFFKDYDKLNKGSVSVENFHSGSDKSILFDYHALLRLWCLGLDLANIGSSVQERNTLSKHYADKNRPGFVSYRIFCDDIEAVSMTSWLQTS